MLINGCKLNTTLCIRLFIKCKLPNKLYYMLWLVVVNGQGRLREQGFFRFGQVYTFKTARLYFLFPFPCPSAKRADRRTVLPQVPLATKLRHQIKRRHDPKGLFYPKPDGSTQLFLRIV